MTKTTNRTPTEAITERIEGTTKAVLMLLVPAALAAYALDVAPLAVYEPIVRQLWYLGLGVLLVTLAVLKVINR